MNTNQALLIYLIITVFIFAILIHIRIKIWSALVLTLLVGQILLNILISPSQITPWSPNGESISSSTAIYIMIQIITPLIVIIYVLVKCWHDRIYIK
jgi:ABC-type transport system involved in cytochrome c biogenesis permease component